MSNNTVVLSSLITAFAARLVEPAQTMKRETYALGTAAGLDPEALSDYVATPLWELFGWEQVKFGPEHGRLSLPDWGELSDPENGGEDAYMAQWHDAMEQVRNEFGLPIGKGHVGIRQVATSRVFDLGTHQWRLIDFLRAPTRRPENPYVLELAPGRMLMTPDDVTLGDGTWAWVRPETIGYAGDLGEGGETLLQNRAFIWDADGVCRQIFKGLIKVSRNLKCEYFAPKAGYGTLRSAQWGDRIEIHPMVDATEYSPKQARVSDQRGSYDGIPGWYKRITPGLNLNLNPNIDGARMILSGAPIGMLPLAERIRVVRESMDAALTLPMGLRRKVAPGIDLRPFEFRAPRGTNGMFVVGQRYVISRDPALPDGTSSWSGVCMGVTKGNFFEVPTNASPLCKRYDANGAPVMSLNAKGVLVHAVHEYGVWEQMGGDFDGDDALVTPHHTQGGVLLGFNDRPEDEQRQLREASGSAGRKGADFKRDYADGNTRWAHARMAAIDLGKFDCAARKVLNKHEGLYGRLLAASVKPAIQWAVDRQKRDLLKPEIPSIVQNLKGTFLMQIVRAMGKPEVESMQDNTSVKYQWDIMMTQVATLESLMNDPELIGDPDQIAAYRAGASWALGIFNEVHKQSMARVGRDGYPLSNAFPSDQIAEYTSMRRMALAQTGAELVDGSGVAEVQDLILLAREKGRHALANAGEALLSRFIAQQDAWDGVEYSLFLSGAQTWVKAAPLSELRAMFSQQSVHRGFMSVDKLSGVTVSAMGKKLLSRPISRACVNTRPVQFAGRLLETGTLRIHQITDGTLRVPTGPHSGRRVANHVLVASVNGFEVARVPGQITRVEALLPEIEAALSA